MKTPRLIFSFLAAAASVLNAQTIGDAVDAPQLTWLTGGNAPWFAQSAVTHDGSDAAQSGVVDDGEQSLVQTVVTGPGTLSFWWKVSSEEGYDFLVLLIDGQFEGHAISGETDWEQRSVVLGPGDHVLLWGYAKDELFEEGFDRGWLDQVVFIPSIPMDVSLSIQRSNNQVTISWPDGLSLVQLEKSTNLNAAAWQSFGQPTTAANLTDLPNGQRAFYRLRLLPPRITRQPANRTVAYGQPATFDVSAEGTATMHYQWRKNGLPLDGQNASSLNFSAATTEDAGNYTVVITNVAGSVTSAVAVLTVTGSAPSFRGIYMGTFAGQVDNGGFAVMVLSNNTAVAVGYNTPQEEGLFITNFTVAQSGSFSALTVQGGAASGTFTSTSVNGTFTNSEGFDGTFSGTRKPDTGIHAANAGYYTGTYTGAFEGSAFAILAADGAVFFYTIDDPSSPTADGDGGGFGTISAANNFSATTVPLGLTVTGTLNTGSKTISGTYRSGGTTLGTFSVTRTSTP